MYRLRYMRGDEETEAHGAREICVQVVIQHSANFVPAMTPIELPKDATRRQCARVVQEFAHIVNYLLML